MIRNDMTFKIGGEAGQGVESSGAGFAKALVRAGLHIFGLPDYHSRIRGGHNFFQITVSDRPLQSHASYATHLMLAMTEEAVQKHLHEIEPGGGIIYDEGLTVDQQAFQEREVQAFPVPLINIAKEAGGSEVMANTAGLGAFAGITDFDTASMLSVIRDNFMKKGEAVVEGNRRVLEAAFEYAQRYAEGFAWKLDPRDLPPRMVIHGNQSFAMGAVMGGCKFCSAYPMTPGSPVLDWIIAHAERYGIAAMQVEDEIAALNMAIGAGEAGVRAVVPTSGGGFSLMVEALGLAGLTETPVVLYIAQRPGPATGLATRTEQGDLLFALHASQGEFPRIVLAPGTIEQAFEAGWRSQNLAERYQCPVIVLSDHFLATSLRDVPAADFGFEAVYIDRGKVLSEAELEALEERYKRHAFTEDGVSPRAYHGHPNSVHSNVSDEYDEYGYITEDAENRRLMMAKRMRKLETALSDMRLPTYYGPEQAELTLVAWGSSFGPVSEAVDLLNADGTKANMLHFTDIWPLPAAAVGEMLQSIKRAVAVENNYSGQFASFLRMQTGYHIQERILKWDGRPLNPEFILAQLEEVL
jgi:2-oxoglutarate ferredoxin oxidoreductase subunit alpha